MYRELEYELVQVPCVPGTRPRGMSLKKIFDDLKSKPSGTVHEINIKSVRTPQSLYWSLRNGAKCRGLNISFSVKRNKLYAVIH